MNESVLMIEAQRCTVQLQPSKVYTMLLAAVSRIAPLDEHLGLPLGFLGSTITMLVIVER